MQVWFRAGRARHGSAGISLGAGCPPRLPGQGRAVVVLPGKPDLIRRVPTWASLGTDAIAPPPMSANDRSGAGAGLPATAQSSPKGALRTTRWRRAQPKHSRPMNAPFSTGRWPRKAGLRPLAPSAVPGLAARLRPRPCAPIDPMRQRTPAIVGVRPPRRETQFAQ